MTYSQGGEEEVILNYFGDSVGTYLDCGAYDGMTFSNTRALAERGWRGVCVEPAPHAFDAMLKNPPPGAKLVNALVAKKTGLTSFLACDDALSTTNRKLARKWPGVTFHPIYTVAISVDDLLAEFPGPYRFVSIDTEGSSVELMKLLSLDDLETEAICVEHDGTKPRIKGFREIFRNGENAILVR